MLKEKIVEALRDQITFCLLPETGVIEKRFKQTVGKKHFDEIALIRSLFFSHW